MLRRMVLGTVVLGGVIAALLAVPAAATPVVDQQQPVLDTGAGYTLAFGDNFPNGEQRLAQVVTPGLTGTLTEVRLAGSCWSPSLTVEIQDVAGGVPIGTVRGSQTSPFAFSWVPTSFSGIVFAAPVSVQEGVPYAIVLRTSGGYCLLWPSPFADSYAGGNAYFMNPVGGGNTWRPMTHGGGHNDLPFQTLVEPPESPLPPAPPAPPAPPPVVVKPVISQATITPAASPGRHVTISFMVTRSDNAKPLTKGTMICDPSIQGKVIRHAEQFTNGVARLALIIPKNAKGTHLKVHLTIKLAGQSATRIATFHVK